MLVVILAEKRGTTILARLFATSEFVVLDELYNNLIWISNTLVSFILRDPVLPNRTGTVLLVSSLSPIAFSNRFKIVD